MSTKIKKCKTNCVDFFSCPLGSSLWNFETIRESLMRSKWTKLASLGPENLHTLHFQFFGVFLSFFFFFFWGGGGCIFASGDNLFKNILDLRS